MLYFLIKTLLSGAIAAAVSEIARRYPTWGGLVASLPLVSLMAMLWTLRDTHDAGRVAALSQSTFWFVIPSLPLFLIVPALIRGGLSAIVAILVASLVTIALYAGFFWLAPRLGITL